MDKHSEQEAQQKNAVIGEAQSKVRFSIHPDGRIEFESEGSDEWAINDAINQARQVASENRSHQRKVKEVAATSEFASHALAVAFITFVVFVSVFSVSRIASTHFYQVQPGVTSNAK